MADRRSRQSSTDSKHRKSRRSSSGHASPKTRDSKSPERKSKSKRASTTSKSIRLSRSKMSRNSLKLGGKAEDGRPNSRSSATKIRGKESRDSSVQRARSTVHDSSSGTMPGSSRASRRRRSSSKRHGRSSRNLGSRKSSLTPSISTSSSRRGRRSGSRLSKTRRKSSSRDDRHRRKSRSDSKEPTSPETRTRTNNTSRVSLVTEWSQNADNTPMNVAHQMPGFLVPIPMIRSSAEKSSESAGDSSPHGSESETGDTSTPRSSHVSFAKKPRRRGRSSHDRKSRDYSKVPNTNSARGSREPRRRSRSRSREKPTDSSQKKRKSKAAVNSVSRVTITLSTSKTKNSTSK